jgi:hypothetical protein
VFGMYPVSLRESLLPEEVRRQPEELARVEVLLDDPVFFAPFPASQSTPGPRASANTVPGPHHRPFFRSK